MNPASIPLTTAQMKDELVSLGLAGAGAGHPRETNLEIIERLRSRDPEAEMGMGGVGGLSGGDILGLVASITGCSKDPAYARGPGYISPDATVHGLGLAGAKLREVCGGGGTVIFGTGHPGSMLAFYADLCALVTILGGKVACPGSGVVLRRFRCPDCGKHDVAQTLDYVCRVGAVSDGDKLLHTHSSAAVEAALDAYAAGGREAPALVFGDHGFAGGAVSRGVDVVCVMDTNDPVVAVAHARGARLTVIPMGDNQPNYRTRRAADFVRQFALGGGTSGACQV